MNRKTTVWPTFTLQHWDWDAEAWTTRQEYDDSCGEDNAYFAVQCAHASGVGPVRLLKDGAAVISDDPATYYGDDDD